MDRIYVCRECGFTVRETELMDWTRHDFVNMTKIPPKDLPVFHVEEDCEGYEVLEEYGA